jgi:hypothetical protein
MNAAALVPAIRGAKLGRGHRLPRTGIAIALLVFVTTLATMLAGGGASSSTLSSGALGWRAARAVLEHEGVEVLLLDRPPEELVLPPATPSPGNAESADATAAAPTLVVGLPFQHAGPSWDVAPFHQTLRRGGRVVVGYSGDVLSFAEDQVMTGFGIELRQRNRELPLDPFAARRLLRRGEEHTASAPGLAPIVTPFSGFVPDAPAGAQVLYRDADGLPIAFRFAFLGGTVWVLPASALANAYLDNPGNLELLLTLRDQLGDVWWFDEYHHGLVGAGVTSEADSYRLNRSRTVDLMLIQGLLAYVLSALALGWRFGPPWPSQPSVEDSHRELLLGLGRVHHRLGHHRDAARALVQRVTDYDPKLPATLSTSEQLEKRLATMDAKGFVTLAAELSRQPAAQD